MKYSEQYWFMDAELLIVDVDLDVDAELLKCKPN